MSNFTPRVIEIFPILMFKRDTFQIATTHMMNFGPPLFLQILKVLPLLFLFNFLGIAKYLGCLYLNFLNQCQSET